VLLAPRGAAHTARYRRAVGRGKINDPALSDETGAGRDSAKLPTGESCITLTTSLPRRVRLGLRPRLLHFPRAPPLRPRQFGIGDSPARIMIGGSPARSWPWWRLSRP